MLKYLFFFLISFSACAQSFDSDIEYFVRKLKLPAAAIAVAKGDSLVYFKGIGYGNEQTREKITADHIFSIASLTKTFTALALEEAVKEGKLSWNNTIGKFPNRFFTPGRWTRETTLAHIVSHTSESNPIGSNFVYNGSKYNIAFNAFEILNHADNTNEITRRFTTELENRILRPLKMDHTIVRYDSVQSRNLENLVVSPRNFTDSSGGYSTEKINMQGIQCGPGFGMMSSASDLIRYSSALNRQFEESFREISKPFYPGSPYGLGWFTTTFEGLKINWVYGYGNNDSAILLTIPEKDLTFIFLCATSVSSASMRLGYGNPLNSPLVVSFLKNYVLHIPSGETVDYQKSEAEILSKIKDLEKKYHSEIFTEELYAKASLGIYLPGSLEKDKAAAEKLLVLYLNNSSTYFDLKNPAVFELIENCKNENTWRLGEKLTKKYQKAGYFHPSVAVSSGKILEKLDKKPEALACYKTLADSDFYRENSDKFFAVMKLARFYYASNPALSKTYLERLIRDKDLISSTDSQYLEAKEMLKKIKN